MKHPINVSPIMSVMNMRLFKFIDQIDKLLMCSGSTATHRVIDWGESVKTGLDYWTAGLPG